MHWPYYLIQYVSTPRKNFKIIIYIKILLVSIIFVHKDIFLLYFGHPTLFLMRLGLLTSLSIIAWIIPVTNLHKKVRNPILFSAMIRDGTDLIWQTWMIFDLIRIFLLS